MQGHETFNSYHLPLFLSAEDIVPRLMAMRYSISLPTAAAEAMSNEPSGDAGSASSTGGGSSSQQASQTMDLPGLQLSAIESKTGRDSTSSFGPELSGTGLQEPLMRQDQPDAQINSGAPPQHWRAKVTNGLEKLRALAAESRASFNVNGLSSTQQTAESPARSRPATPDNHRCARSFVLV